MTAGLLIRRVLKSGQSNFIPGFASQYPKVISAVGDLEAVTLAEADKIRLRDIIPDK